MWILMTLLSSSSLLLSSSFVEGCTTAATTLTRNVQLKRTTATRLKCRWLHVNVYFQCQHDAEHHCSTVKVVLLPCCSTDKEGTAFKSSQTFTNYILRKSISRGKLQSNADKTPENGSLLALLKRKLLLAADSWPTVSNKMCFGPNIWVVLLTTLTWSIHLALIGCLIRDQSTNIQQQWCQVICDKTKSWKHCKCFRLSYWYSANTGALLLFIFFFYQYISAIIWWQSWLWGPCRSGPRPPSPRASHCWQFN